MLHWCALEGLPVGKGRGRGDIGTEDFGLRHANLTEDTVGLPRRSVGQMSRKKKMEPTNPNANAFEKLICPNDTLVGHSCGTFF